MTVSISNMAQVWMSNTNTYNGIAMSISTMGYGANANSKLLTFKVDANIVYDVYASGIVFAKTSTVANLPNARVVSAGAKTIVTDANQNSFLANVFSGGSNVVPVFSDGTRWKIG